MTEMCGRGYWWRESRRMAGDSGGMVSAKMREYVHMKSQPKKNREKYANGSVGARVRLMVRGGCLPVSCSKGMEWNYDDDLCGGGGDKRNRDPCDF